MKVRDEHAILRGLEDIRIAEVMEPYTPDQMRLLASAAEDKRRRELQAESMRKERERRAKYAAMQREAERDRRIEAWKRGEPDYLDEQPRGLPPEAVMPEVYGFTSYFGASAYPVRSASMGYGNYFGGTSGIW